MLRFFALERLLDVTRNVYSEGHKNQAQGHNGQGNKIKVKVGVPPSDSQKVRHAFVFIMEIFSNGTFLPVLTCTAVLDWLDSENTFCCCFLD